MKPGYPMLAIEDVEKYLILSPTFQERLDTADPEKVAAHIYYCESEYAPPGDGATLAPLRPYVLLAPEQLAYEQGSEGETTILYAKGGVIALFNDNPATPGNNKESFRDYWGWVSAVLDEISSMHRTDNHFRFEIALQQPPWRPSLTERPADDFWESAFLFTYATGGR